MVLPTPTFFSREIKCIGREGVHIIKCQHRATLCLHCGAESKPREKARFTNCDCRCGSTFIGRRTKIKADGKKKSCLCKCHSVMLSWPFTQCFPTPSAATWRKELFFFNEELKALSHGQNQCRASTSKTALAKTMSRSWWPCRWWAAGCECDTLALSPRFLMLSAGAGRGRVGAHLLLVPAVGPTASENFTDTEGCFPTGNYFGRLCTDAYGIYSYFSPSLFNIGICWCGSAACERKHCWKNIGAITGKQNSPALFMNCIQIGHHIMVWFAYKLH